MISRYYFLNLKMSLIIGSSQILWFYSLLLSLLFFAISLLLLHARKWTKTSIQRPPSPPALPIIGHLHLIGPDVAKSFKTLAASYGPIIRLQMVSKSSIIVSNASVAKEILKDNEMSFISRPELGCSDYNIYDGLSFIFADYGPYWRFMRKLCMTELFSIAQVSRFADIRREEMMKLVEILVRCSDEGKACNLGEEFLRLTNNSTCRMVMSTKCMDGEDESKQILEFLKGMGELMAKLSFGEMLGPLRKLDLFGYGRKLKKLFTSFDALLERIMVEHENDHMLPYKGKGKKDLMDLLLEIHRDENAEVKLTRMHIKSLILELFAAGTDTTATALQWTIAELINHPQKFQKLKQEIHAVVGSQRLVEESDIQNLPYLEAVVKESLRLHPPTALIVRRSIKDCKINGYDIFANEGVLINQNSITRDPESWENPLDFIPERFMFKSQGHSIDQHDRGQNFKMLPFGSGRRGCPGASLALATVHGVIGVLAQCFDFQVKGGEEVNMEENARFLKTMVHPLLCYPIVTQSFNSLMVAKERLSSNSITLRSND